jgi:hypothetical protein
MRRCQHQDKLGLLQLVAEGVRKRLRSRMKEPRRLYRLLGDILQIADHVLRFPDDDGQPVKEVMKRGVYSL